VALRYYYDRETHASWQAGWESAANKNVWTGEKVKEWKARIEVCHLPNFCDVYIQAHNFLIIAWRGLSTMGRSDSKRPGPRGEAEN